MGQDQASALRVSEWQLVLSPSLYQTPFFLLFQVGSSCCSWVLLACQGHCLSGLSLTPLSHPFV